jgi:hypothetical protein
MCWRCSGHWPKAYNMKWEDIELKATRKRAERGGFDRQIFLEHVDQDLGLGRSSRLQPVGDFGGIRIVVLFAGLGMRCAHDPIVGTRAIQTAGRGAGMTRPYRLMSDGEYLSHRLLHREVNGPPEVVEGRGIAVLGVG